MSWHDLLSVIGRKNYAVAIVQRRGIGPMEASLVPFVKFFPDGFIHSLSDPIEFTQFGMNCDEKPSPTSPSEVLHLISEGECAQSSH